MATAKPSITIGDKKVTPYHVTLHQKCNRHHRFQVVISSEKIESDNSIAIDNSIGYIGKIMEIKIECGGNELLFKGVITKIHIDRTYAGDNHIVFTGYSPTYLMEDGAGTKSYAEKDLKGIVDEILGKYPANQFNSKVSPQYTEQIPYVVRYKETDYHFVSRLAAIYGEWFYYDGQSVIFGELENPDSVELTLGKDLNSFDFGVQVRPDNFTYQSYHYEENSVIEKSTADFKPSWMDDYSEKILDAADDMFTEEPLIPVWHNARNESLVQHLAETRKSSILSDAVFFKGESQNAAVSVGGRISAQSKSKGEDGSSTAVIIGRFRVTAVTHHLNANNDYTNHFEAIPLTVPIPPVNMGVHKPEAESQVAIVKKNNDPDEMGRIRVQFKWQTGDEMTPWIRQMTNYGSEERGIYFVPEIEDEVYIDFEQGNPDRPYMQGALYHGKKKPEFFDADNNLKAIKTRSGHTILMDDKDGEEKITILDKNDNQIILNTKEESITISAPKKILIESEEIEMKGDNITISASSELKADGDNVTIAAGSELKESGSNVTIGADSALKLNGGSTAELVSAAVDISGQSSVKIAGATTEVGGNGMLDLKSGGVTNVQGALVKIN